MKKESPNKVEFRTLANYPEYEINNEGKVRSIKTKKYKAIYTDKKTEKPIVLLVDPNTKYTVYEFISDLMHENFGTPDEDIFNERKVEKLEKELEVAKANARVPRMIIRCEETGEEFKSYQAVVSRFGFDYGRFYNTFYFAKDDVLEFEGHTFTRTKNR